MQIYHKTCLNSKIMFSSLVYSIYRNPETKEKKIVDEVK